MQDEINACIDTLKKGGIILYPTDTVWGLGCDATNAEAVDRLFALKNRPNNKAMICLVSDFKMLNQYVEEVPEVAYDILKYANKPTTIVYEKPIRIAENLVGEDDTLGIRVPKNEFCSKLIRKFKKPIVSTSANFAEEPTPKKFKSISQSLKDQVDYIVKKDFSKPNVGPSSVIKIGLSGEVKILRK
ncbi:MAG: L-threonylcarbamoyladenylate synthase [Psychroflexus maritimus]